MKKNYPAIVVAALFTLGILSSCKKEYNCRCTASYMGLSADTAIALGKVTKKDAKDKCSAFQTTYQTLYTAFATGATIDCDVEK